jgi:hypothetical protein
MNPMNALMNVLPGSKTYVTAGVGIFVAWLVVWMGDASPVGTLDSEAALKLTWEGLLVIFLRKGIGSK